MSHCECFLQHFVPFSPILFPTKVALHNAFCDEYMVKGPIEVSSVESTSFRVVPRAFEDSPAWPVVRWSEQ